VLQAVHTALVELEQVEAAQLATAGHASQLSTVPLFRNNPAAHEVHCELLLLLHVIADVQPPMPGQLAHSVSLVPPQEATRYSPMPQPEHGAQVSAMPLTR
jgi:hypothetical protein